MQIRKISVRSLARLPTILILAIGLHASPPTLAALPAGVQTITSIEGVTEYRLQNGLRVLLLPDASKPLITANLVYLVGSKHEGAGEGGMAHLLEHMLFKGTPTTADPKAEFIKRGMQWNGTTSFDRTNYFATFSPESDSLDWYLGWLADSMVNSFIARRDLDSEMTVVRNEFERGEANPGYVLSRQMMASAYRWHPYGKPTIGSLSDIENVSIDSLQRFYRLYYQPDNAVLVVAGQFEVDPVLARIVSVFGKIPKPQRKLPPLYTQEPVQEGERAVTLRRVGNVPIIASMYHTVAGGGRDAVTQVLLNYILSDQPNGRLHKALVETGLASSASASIYDLQDPGVLIFSVVPADKVDADRVQAALLEALESMPPVTSEEVERARTAILNSTNRLMLDANNFARNLTSDIATGDWRLAFAQRDWIKDVTVADINRLARSYLIPANRTLGRYVPTETPLRAPVASRVDTDKLLAGYVGKKAAAPIDSFPMTNLEIEARTVKTVLPGGMKIATLTRPSKGDRVIGIFHTHWGSLDTLRGRRADSLLLSSMMLKGTASMNRQALNDKLNALDATISVTAGASGASVDFSVPKANFAQMVELVRDILRKPVFPETEFEQARRAAVSANQASLNNPGTLANIALWRNQIRYPDDDPRSIWDLKQTLRASQTATLAATQAFYETFAGANVSELAVVGPVESARVLELFKNAFDDWQSSLPYQRIAHVSQDNGAIRGLINTPDQANAVYVGHQPLEMDDDDPDMPALYVAVQLLGGRSDSRLWKRLREKDGLSYGVNSSLSTNLRDKDGSISISGTYAPGNRDRFEAAVREELVRALKEGFTEAEVAAAKGTILKLRRQSLASEHTVGSILAYNLYWNRSLQQREQRDQRYAAVTLDEVNAALRKYVKPEKLSVVVAGDFDKKVSEMKTGEMKVSDIK
ncbi:pitrilysin family protein [soil metagenome]